MAAKPRGFTLIELLVVIVVIGLIAGAMVMTLGDDQRRGLLRQEGERLQATVALALEEAQLYGYEIGLQIAEDRYRFLRWRDGKWQTIDDDRAYDWRKLPDGLLLSVALDGLPQGLKLPGVRINSRGEVELLSAEDSAKQLALEKQQQQIANPELSENAGKDASELRDDALAESSEQAQARAELGNDTLIDDERDSERLMPQIFLMSSGEVTPFVIGIGSRDTPPVFLRLRGYASGCTRIEGPLDADLDADLQMEWPDDAAQETDAADRMDVNNSDPQLRRCAADRRQERSRAAG